VCVRVVDEDESRRLNRDYRHRDAPTNVLSFPAAIDLPDALVWGDVVVCAPVVQREADAQGKPYEGHFAHMVVHGVLHLLGYDHQAAAAAAAMEKLEIRILDGFGISDPYGEG
jgi:probable rRNA maturation factor